MKPRRSGEQHIIKSWFIKSSQGSAKFNVAANWQVTLQKMDARYQYADKMSIVLFFVCFLESVLSQYIFTHAHTQADTHPGTCAVHTHTHMKIRKSR